MGKLDCDGISLDENNGSSQEVKHFHLHIIPKYKGQNEVKYSLDDIFHQIVD